MSNAIEAIRLFENGKIADTQLLDLLIGGSITFENVDAVFELLAPKLRLDLGILAGIVKRGGLAVATGVGWIRNESNSESVNAIIGCCERRKIAIDSVAFDDWWRNRRSLPFQEEDDGFRDASD